jgi:Gpi18-like mannosyltransferase
MRWRPALATIAALFLISRGALVLVALLLENSIPLSYHGPTFSTEPLLRSLTGSDSVYLLGIAAEGYHAAPVQAAFRDWVFFPLYPLVTRAASVLTLGDIAVAGVLVSNAAFVAALAVLYRLAALRLEPDRALRSLAFVALAPGAVAFAMAYSDSLFLLLAAGAFLAAEQRRWPLLALLYALATLTRLQGLLLAIPLAMLIAESSGGWRHAASWRTPALGFLIAGPLAFGAFAAYLGTSFGEPFGMLTAQQAWSDIGNAAAGNTTAVLNRFNPIVLLLVGTLCFYLFLFVYFRADRMPAPYAALAAVTLLTALATGRLQSIARYLAVGWPFAWTLAGRRSAWFELLGISAFAALFVIDAMLHFTQALAP